MKKRYAVIIGVFSWILGIGMGIMFSGEKESYNIEETVKSEVKNEENITKVNTSNDKIIPATKMLYKYYYDKKTETKESEAPYFLLGKTREELEQQMPEWQCELFSSEKVVLSKKAEESIGECYIVSAYEGYVAAFSESKDNIIEVTQTPVSSLSPEEQENINRGIVLNSRYELSRCLENYSS